LNFFGTQLFLGEIPNVADELFDLIVGKLALVGGHCALAARDHISQLGVSLILNVRGMKITNLHRLSHGRVAASIGSMASRAFGLEKAGGVLSSNGSAKQKQASNKRKDYGANSSVTMIHDARPSLITSAP